MSILTQIDLTVIIITRNEERRLPPCLASLPAGCEIIVVDSESGDRTREIAAVAGAKCLTRPFDNYAAQKNYALAHATRRWILSIDADESLDPKMISEIGKVVAAEGRDDQPNIYRLKRQLVFQGRPMRFGKTVDAPMRLFQRSSAEFSGVIHERLVGNGLRIGKLVSGVLFHHSYEDLEDYFARFNRYTTLVAQENYRKTRKPGFFDAGRIWLDFLSRYIVRLGFLDGYPGYCYALVSSFYGFVKHAKLREIYQKAATDGK